MYMTYDKVEVQNWIKQVETALDFEKEVTPEEDAIYDQIQIHYDAAAEKIGDEGLSEEAAYEVEVAYKLLDQLSYEFQVMNTPRGDQDWNEWVEEQLEEEE